MTEEITLEEALKLVTFKKDKDGEWQIRNVLGYVHGYVLNGVCGSVGGSVGGYVGGNVLGNVHGYVLGSVIGTVKGDIYSDEWQRVETPKQKLKRLIEEGANKEKLLEAVHQLEGN